MVLLFQKQRPTTIVLWVCHEAEVVLAECRMNHPAVPVASSAPSDLIGVHGIMVAPRLAAYTNGMAR